MSTRSRALAVLDSAGVGTSRDSTREHTQRASKFASCFRGGDRIGAWSLAQLLSAAIGSSPDGLRATATLAKISAYPIDALAWAWADRGLKPGQLDDRAKLSDRRCHPWQDDSVTAIGAAMGWWREPESPRGILVLSGDTGCGKTTAAILASVHHGGRFIRAAQLGEMGFGQADALMALALEPLLILDELGMETDIGPTRTRIVELLGTRHDQGLATLITTHLKRVADDKTSFSDRYGNHLLDRIERSGQWMELGQSTRRGRERPSLERLRRSCRIADLLPKVEALTGTGGGSRALIDELQTLLGITDEMVDAGLEERAGWTSRLLEEADGLTGPAGALVKAALLGKGTGSMHREVSHG